jgi:nitroreductase
MLDSSPATRFNDCSDMLSLLLTRRSARARDLVAPGPNEGELATILGAATRVPDHGKLAPWRFVTIADREAFSALITTAWRADRPDAGRLELEALDFFARQAPCLVAALSCPRESHIPTWEQELSMGAAIMNLLLAAHAMGYVGNWLTGAAAYLPAVADALGGRPAGFIFLGTASKPLEERPRPDPDAVIGCWPG